MPRLGSRVRVPSIALIVKRVLVARTFLFCQKQFGEILKDRNFTKLTINILPLCDDTYNSMVYRDELGTAMEFYGWNISGVLSLFLYIIREQINHLDQ